MCFTCMFLSKYNYIFGELKFKSNTAAENIDFNKKYLKNT